jgi:hypothetical protein
MTISHKNLKRFYLNGEIADDSIIPRIKLQYIELLKNAMRYEGYVIRYDIDPDFTLSYNGKSFDFELSIYGVFVGRKKAQWISGVDKNRIIENTTRQSKSDESCNHVASI